MADEPKDELQHLAFEDRIVPELRAINEKLDAIETQLHSILQKQSPLPAVPRTTATNDVIQSVVHLP